MTRTQPARGFADKRQYRGRRKDGAKTNVARDVSVEAVKHSSFFQNGRHRVTAPRTNLSDDEFHKVKCRKTEKLEI